MVSLLHLSLDLGLLRLHLLKDLKLLGECSLHSFWVVQITFEVLEVSQVDRVAVFVLKQEMVLLVDLAWRRCRLIRSILFALSLVVGIFGSVLSKNVILKLYLF